MQSIAHDVSAKGCPFCLRYYSIGYNKSVALFYIAFANMSILRYELFQHNSRYAYATITNFTPARRGLMHDLVDTGRRPSGGGRADG